jgi:putative acetyltransferase
MAGFTVAPDDPRAADVHALLAAHLAFTTAQSPPEDMHALDLDGLLRPDISFFSIRDHGALLGIGALKQLDARHVELKSMHTAVAARGRGVGRAMVLHLLAVSRARGCTRVSLETGSMASFAPAQALYESVGFEVCGPFGDYVPSPNSTFMTLSLEASA